MVDTETLIAILARDARPVRRLPPPVRRVVKWLAIALPVIAVFGAITGTRPDLTERLAEPVFLMQLLAGMATAVCAAFAAFASCDPTHRNGPCGCRRRRLPCGSAVSAASAGRTG